MPVITFEAGAMSEDVKAELLTRLTDVAVEVTGIPKHLYFVSIHELPDTHIAVGGLSVAEIKRNLQSKQT
ncbi:tautomerase family protein [Rhizobium sp. FKY42]|uniref:tautomerase family protein n=1 Tax=Rhizobium sp. FKY42 TaxID=2562310 RepID=UPI0010C02539|nr:tautomerase family protein [Rhizobium sp. FKY42]